MTIETLSLDQQQSYQQQHSSKRTIKRLNISSNINVAEKVNTNRSQSAQFNASFLTSKALNNVHPSNTGNLLNANTTTNSPANNAVDKTVEEDIYQRPLPAKVKLIKLILDSYFGKDLTLSEKQFDYNKVSEQLSQTQQTLFFNQQSTEQLTLNTQNFALINIDGKQFNQQEQVSVTTLSTEQQQLNFTMQGEFILDNQTVNLSYQLNLSASYSSMSKIETTAAALKDPLVIQFGTRSIGHITDYAQLDINSDSKQDDLPIFSGDVGYLVFDKNQNNRVDDGRELFGPRTNNGFDELAQLDSNNNGFFDSQDENYSQVYIWQPQHSENNSNTGSSSESNKQNLVSLSQAGIKAISLNAIATQFNFRDQRQENNGEISAQLKQTSFAITDNNQTVGVHQIDVRL